MIDIRDYGYRYDSIDCPDGLLPARVVEVRRAQYTAVCVHGETPARLAGAFAHAAEGTGDIPTVGDFVFIKYNDSGPSGITRVLPRASTFVRADFSGHKESYAKTVLEQVVAANFDYVLIMSSLNGDFNLNRIARYLTAARGSGGTPIVALTKADLCEDFTERVNAVKAMAPGVAVIALSSVTGLGLNVLSAYMHPGVTAVFLGMSGVGKSSLLNVLAGREVMAVSAIREADGRGRHTTTHRQLSMLPSGAMIIDTPGMRALGLWDADESISASFADVEALIARCAFSNCGHISEPGCAVRTALGSGALPIRTWENYLSQRSEAAFVARKAGTGKRKQNNTKQPRHGMVGEEE